MNPNIEMLIENLTPLCSKILIRTNLIAINKAELTKLIDTLKKNRVTIIASFPSINESQTNSQRGDNIFQESIKTLKTLNRLGYGDVKNSGLELNLVSNPTGAFMPAAQEQVEKDFVQYLIINGEFNLTIYIVLQMYLLVVLKHGLKKPAILTTTWENSLQTSIHVLYKTLCAGILFP